MRDVLDPASRSIEEATSPSLTDRAYRRIRADILNCALAPGERITELHLVEKMGLSRMPVREALKRLVAEGLMRMLPKRGYMVAPITFGDIDELFSFRAIVESGAAALAADRIDSTTLEELRKLGAVTYEDDNEDSIKRFLRTNAAFHRAIALATENRRLVAAIERLISESDRLIHYGMKSFPQSLRTESEHRALIDALERRDRDLASKLAREHVETTRQMILQGVLSAARLRDVPL